MISYYPQLEEWTPELMGIESGIGITPGEMRSSLAKTHAGSLSC
jgi:hypothetical protein